MAKKDTIYALIRRGITDGVARKLANYYTISYLKKATIEEIVNRGFTEEEAKKILLTLGADIKREKEGKKKEEKEGKEAIEEKREKKEIKEGKEKIIKQFTEIKGIGMAKAKALYEAGFTSKLELRLSPIEVISTVEGIGKKHAERIKEELTPSKEEVLEDFSAIKGIGNKKAEALWESGFQSLLDLQIASEEEIGKIEGITTAIAREIKEKVGSIEVSKVLRMEELLPPPSIEEPEKNAKLRSRIINLLNQYLPNSIIDELVMKLDKDIDEKLLEKIIQRILEEYEKNCVDPAEACGIVGAQSIGEPGTQMSLSPNEKIIIRDENGIKIKEIGKFVDRLMDRFGSKKIGESDVCDLPNDTNVFVPSLNREEKIEWKRISSCSRHKSPKKLLKIVTRSGRKIIATDSHSFVIRKENEIIPVSGKEIDIHERLPVMRKIPVHCINSLDLGNFLDFDQMKYAVTKRGFIYPYPHKKSLPQKIELDWLFGWLVGAYLAEGNSTKYYVSISNVNEEFLSNVRKFANRHDLTYNEYDNYRGFTMGHDIRINSSLLSNLIKTACDTGASKKEIPNFAYDANVDFLCGLLRGYFDGDGSISVEQKSIRISSSSEELIDGIAILLNRLGIFSSKVKGREYWLNISYRYAPLFTEKIGSDIKDKRDKLRKLCEFCSGTSSKSYDVIDMIPGFGNIFKEIANKIDFPKRLVNNFTKRQRIGRTTLYRYIKKFEKMANEKKVDISKDIEILRKMLDSDVVWDEIKSISYEEANEKYVYDVSVNGLETFTTLDGIITHNTMRTFHYAGVAEINVTLGLPRLIEIVDARRAPSTPMMNIYLEGGYRIDPWMAEKMANKIEVTKLLNVAEVETDLENMRMIVKLDEKAMKKRDIKEGRVIDCLEKIQKGEVEKGKMGIIVHSKYKTYKEMQQLSERVKDAKIKGIDGIKRAIIRKEDGGYVIYTEGSNLAEVLKLDVDATRTTTNDIQAIYKALGVEAARNAIINEAFNTLREQGLTVDIRHIMLVADIMTSNGTIRAIGRQGVSGEKSSVIARAGFEITLNHLLRAGQRGEIDPLEGVAENVIVGQPIKLGTGLIKLSMDTRKK